MRKMKSAGVFLVLLAFVAGSKPQALLAQKQKTSTPKPKEPSPETIAGFKTAGAIYGTLYPSQFVSAGSKPGTDIAEVGIPGFKLRTLTDLPKMEAASPWERRMPCLPHSEVDFGMDLSGTQVIDGEMEILMGQDNLISLSLRDTPLTDAALKSLAQFEEPHVTQCWGNLGLQ